MIGSTALSLAGTATQASAANKQAEAQGRYQNDVYSRQTANAVQIAEYENEMYNRTADEAVSAYFDEVSSLQRFSFEQDEQFAQVALRNAREADAAEGVATVNAGARGVSGVSVRDMLADYARIEAENSFALNRTAEFSNNQTMAEMRSAQARAQSRIAAARPGPRAGHPAPPPPPVGANPLATGLQMGSTLLGGYTRYREYQNAGLIQPKPKPSPVFGGYFPMVRI